MGYGSTNQASSSFHPVIAWITPALSVTQSAAAAAVRGLWRYISVCPFFPLASRRFVSVALSTQNYLAAWN